MATSSNRTKRWSGWLIVAGLLLTVVASATEPSTYTRGPTSSADGGSGRYYQGREIATVMGHEGAGWLERPERSNQEQTSRLLHLLPVRTGITVADVGAGTGYIARRIAEKIGPTGVVYAEDIQPEMLQLLRERLLPSHLRNVEVVLGSETDPKLPGNALDLILLVDVYHEFAYPYEMMQALIRSLRQGGEIAFVEFKLENPEVPILRCHKMSVEQIKKEMRDLPLRFVSDNDSLPWQHVILFQLIR